MALITENGERTLKDRYYLEGEDFEGLVNRITTALCRKPDHRARMYSYMLEGKFLPATPILSNAGTTRGLPISCFLNKVSDTFFSQYQDGIADTWNENVALAKGGGGIGTDFSAVREKGSPVAKKGTSSGIIPFLKVQDSLTLAISQGDLRRGSTAVYLRINHPEIVEFIDIRRPKGDPRRCCLDLNHGVLITDEFMNAVLNNEDFHLKNNDGATVETVKAKMIWGLLMQARIETGEPYFIFTDTVKRATPKHHAKLGLYPEQSNLCTEITLPTGKDRTAVCCLGSINLAEVPMADDLFVKDCLRFLDNALSLFITNAPKQMARAIYSACHERSVGLGFLGYHTLIQKQGKTFKDYEAANYIFSAYKESIDKANYELGEELGSCPDYNGEEGFRRFSYASCIAPTANISFICGEVSPGIEPIPANAYRHDTLSGSFFIKNRVLEKRFEELGMNTPEIWTSILENDGSVQHLDFKDKEVFLTAFEIDQHEIIKQAGERQKYIDQAQSINLFIDTKKYTKKEISKLHIDSWRYKLKSLYYCRSKSVMRPERVACDINNKECDSCQ